jgi:putative tryptophan/tyrosine transport system substrate-binding protein
MASYIRRRKFLATLLGGAAAAWSLAARAQQASLPVIGILGGNTGTEWQPFMNAFKLGLQEAGYVDGQNVSIEYRWADGRYEQLPALATDLVRRRVDVIAAVGGVNAALAAKAATSDIPIVFLTGRDPVELGFVDSFNRPGRNLTGISMLNDELNAKRLELLRELMPNAATIAILVNPDNRNHPAHVKVLEAVARSGGQQAVVIEAAADRDFEAAFAKVRQQRADALMVLADPFFDSHSRQIVELVGRHAVPTIFVWREFVQAGALISYGMSLADAHHQQGLYAGKILRGAKPAELPVVQPTRFELFINLKTARALGLTVPASILLRADEVIE